MGEVPLWIVLDFALPKSVLKQQNCYKNDIFLPIAQKLQPGFLYSNVVFLWVSMLLMECFFQMKYPCPYVFKFYSQVIILKPFTITSKCFYIDLDCACIQLQQTVSKLFDFCLGFFSLRKNFSTSWPNIEIGSSLTLFIL